MNPLPSCTLAIDQNGKKITSDQIIIWLQNAERYKCQLSDFVYNRLHGRYIKPFTFIHNDFIESYKSGFSIMANCCLLIETYSSFCVPDFGKPGNSERCFGWFFQSDNNFKCFSKDGLTLDDYLNPSKKIKKENSGIPKDFYENIRCGILHSGETQKHWRIFRKGSLLNIENEVKIINANKFMNNLEKTLSEYQNILKIKDIKSEEWKNCLSRINKIISHI